MDAPDAPFWTLRLAREVSVLRSRFGAHDMCGSRISPPTQIARSGAIDRQRVTFVELGTPRTLRTYLGLPSSSAEHSLVPNPRLLSWRH